MSASAESLEENAQDAPLDFSLKRPSSDVETKQNGPPVSPKRDRLEEEEDEEEEATDEEDETGEGKKTTQRNCYFLIFNWKTRHFIILHYFRLLD